MWNERPLAYKGNPYIFYFIGKFLKLINRTEKLLTNQEKETEKLKLDNEKLKAQLVESEEKWKELKDAVAEMRRGKATSNSYERKDDEVVKHLRFGVSQRKYSVFGSFGNEPMQSCSVRRVSLSSSSSLASLALASVYSPPSDRFDHRSFISYKYM